MLFNHAIRYEWLEQGRNPITLVRQSAMRKSTPEVLDPNEIQSLLLQLDSCFRLMVMLDVTTGLRRSELFALKWLDVDFSNLTIDVQRSIYLGKIGTCKTEASRKPVPLDERVAADLWLWKESSKYQDPSDWIFASPRVDGKQPFWPDIVLQKIIRPAAVRAGIRKRIGWHTFRHTYSTLLIGNGENVKVVQELMRHASTRFTIEVYTQARIEAKRQAQQAARADNSLRRERWIGTRDPWAFRCRRSMSATAHGRSAWTGFAIAQGFEALSGAIGAIWSNANQPKAL